LNHLKGKVECLKVLDLFYYMQELYKLIYPIILDRMLEQTPVNQLNFEFTKHITRQATLALQELLEEAKPAPKTLI
jgi:hypothetical protein